MYNILQQLNTILKGEIMAINSYEEFIKQVDNIDVKQDFINFKNDHKRHADLMEERIKSLGGHPVKGTGTAGIMAGAKFAVENLKKRSVHDIVKNAYDGEDKGIAAVAKIKETLDDENKKVVEEMLSTDHDHLKKMKDIINNHTH